MKYLTSIKTVKPRTKNQVHHVSIVGKWGIGHGIADHSKVHQTAETQQIIHQRLQLTLSPADTARNPATRRKCVGS